MDLSSLWVESVRAELNRQRRSEERKVREEGQRRVLKWVG